MTAEVLSTKVVNSGTYMPFEDKRLNEYVMKNAKRISSFVKETIKEFRVVPEQELQIKIHEKALQLFPEFSDSLYSLLSADMELNVFYGIIRRNQQNTQ